MIHAHHDEESGDEVAAQVSLKLAELVNEIATVVPS
jgi:hypothetical protein